jgi:hypothetical protein
MRSKPLIIGMLGIATTLMVTACGTSGGSNAATRKPVSTVATLLAADQSTTGQKTAKLSMVEKITVEGHQVTLNATGASNFVSHALLLHLSVAGQQLEMRQLGGIIYAKLPANLAGHVPGNKPWLAIDLNSLATSASGSTLSQLQSTGQTDPSDLLAYLKGISADGAHRIGSATIRGVKTTEYAVSVDSAKALASARAVDRKALKAAMKQLGASTIPMKVWVDSSQLVRQLSFSVGSPASSSNQGSAASVNVTMQLYDFGTAVNVTAPPKSEQFDLTSALADGSASGTTST